MIKSISRRRRKKFEVAQAVNFADHAKQAQLQAQF